MLLDDWSKAVGLTPGFHFCFSCGVVFELRCVEISVSHSFFSSFCLSLLGSVVLSRGSHTNAFLAHCTRLVMQTLVSVCLRSTALIILSLVVVVLVSDCACYHALARAAPAPWRCFAQEMTKNKQNWMAACDFSQLLTPTKTHARC